MRISILFVIILIFIPDAAASSAEQGNIRIADIVKNIGEYEGKNIVMKLRLLNYSVHDNRITFYDMNNMNITFNTADKAHDNGFTREVMNFHMGMEYIVEFKAEKRQNGILTGIYVSSIPVILQVLPFRDGKEVKKAE